MPVVSLEYTNNLAIGAQVKPFLKEVHNILVEIIKTDLLTCRSTITCHEDYVIGDSDPRNAFIQLSIRMLPGRSKETKDELGHRLFTMIKQAFSKEIEKHTTQVRVYLTEVDRDYYYGL
jgi:5-carboxymethyl-2-hydroxymuconate isomerase